MWCPPTPDRALPRQWWDKPLEVSRAFSLPRATCHCRLQGLSDPFSLTLLGHPEPAASLPQAVGAATLCLLSLHLELLLASSSGHPPKHSRHRCSHPPLVGPVGHVCPPRCSRGTSHAHVSLQSVLGRGEEVLAVGAANSHDLQLGWRLKQSRGKKPALQGKCGKPKDRRCAGSHTGSQ